MLFLKSFIFLRMQSQVFLKLLQTFILFVLLSIFMHGPPAQAESHFFPDFEALFERHGSIMLVIDVDTGKIVRANQAALDFYGYSSSEIRHLTIHNINALSFAEVEAEMRKAISEDRNFFQFQHQLADGQIRHVEVYSYPFSTQEGNLLYSIINDVTARKQAEQNLKAVIAASGIIFLLLGMTALGRHFSKSRIAQRQALEREAKLSAIYKAARNIGIIVTDLDFKIVEFSPGAEKIFGFSKTEVLGKHVGMFHKEQDISNFPDFIKRLKSSKQGFSIETELRKRNNAIFPAILTIEPYQDHNNNIVGTLGISIDITTLKKAEEKLIQSEARFRQMAENIDEVFWLRSADNRTVLYVNEAYETIWGRTCQSLYDNPSDFISSVHPLDKQRVMEEYNKELSDTSDGRFNLEYRIQRPDGSIRWVWARSFPVKDETGITVRYTGIAVDVTERKIAEQALAGSELKLRGITDSTLDAVLMMDHNGNISFWNPAAKSIFGYTRDQAMGRNLHMLLAPPEYHDQYRQAFPEFQRTGKGSAVGKNIELKALRSDQTVIPVSLSLSAFELNGKWNAVGIVRDISQLKKNEQELIKAKEQAEEASKAKSIFLANMSHEIRTPMAGIMGALKMLSSTVKDPDSHKLISMTLDSASSLKQIINDILDLSKVEAGKMELVFHEFSLRELLHRVEGLFSIQAESKGLTLSCQVSDELSDRFMGDSFRLEQVLRNLVGNAIKFTDKGWIIMRVNPLKSTDLKTTLLFEVEDTGEGIPHDLKTRIFESFIQADSSYSKKIKGTGLGLTISQKIINMMGGKIEIKSQPGAGSIFSFNLELDALPEKKQKVRSAESASDAPAPASSPKLNILVAEDVELNQEYLKFVLKDQGHHLTLVNNGLKAVQAFKPGKYDLILMDIQMPEMDGTTAAEKIQTIEAESGLAQKTPIIALTAYAMAEDRKKFMKAGMAGYVSKPINKDSLIGEMKRVLKEQS